MNADTESRGTAAWDRIVKTLHWTLALAIAAVVPAGFVMSTTYGPSFKDARVLALHTLASQIHHTTGILILAAALWWMVRRWRRGRPERDLAAPAYERVLAASVHGLLLLLLLVIPWSGWTALSALADSPAFGVTHRWFFGSDGWLPRIWSPKPFNDPSGYALFARIHIVALWVGLATVGLHIASALWHHWVRKDRILRRMWPLGGD